MAYGLAPLAIRFYINVFSYNLALGKLLKHR